MHLPREQSMYATGTGEEPEFMIRSVRSPYKVPPTNASKYKRMLVLASELSQWSYHDTLKEDLVFLRERYIIDIVHPLNHFADSGDPIRFQRFWRQRLEQLLPQYDVVLGYSLGGLLLQHCFCQSLLNNKKIILMSVPSTSNSHLISHVLTVIRLIKADLLSEALFEWDRCAAYPHKADNQLYCEYSDRFSRRLLCGLRMLLQVNARGKLQRSKIGYLHLFGQHSLLVNRLNVIGTKKSTLIEIPNTGTRILHDAHSDVQAQVEKYLLKIPQ